MICSYICAVRSMTPPSSKNHCQRMIYDMFRRAASGWLCFRLFRLLGLTQLSFDLEQAVVLGKAFGAGDGAYLDLIAAPADSEIGEPVVFGLARAGADDDTPGSAARELQC